MKKIFVLALICVLLTGCAYNVATSSSEPSKVTDIMGENNLNFEELAALLKETFGDIIVETEELYNEEVITVTFNTTFDEDKTQEAINQAVMNRSFDVMKITQYVKVNYINPCRIDVEFEINDGGICYYTRSNDMDYLDGNTDKELLLSYMGKVDVLVTGQSNIRNSLINAFQNQFNITPNHV